MRVPAALATAALTASVVVTGGCGGDEQKGPKQRPLTDSQASLMAGVLDENRRAGGARFRATTVDEPGGSTVTLDGQVDWRRHTGHATVASSVGANGVTEVGWSRRAVIEDRPGLRDEVGRARRGAVVIARPPDQRRRRLDQVIAVVGGLAARRRDNPLLIAQKPGSAFLRTDTVNGTRALVLRYGRNTVMWIDPKTRRLVRLETSGSAGVPTIVDLLEVGPQDVPGPDPRKVVAASQLRPSYRSLAPTSP